MHYEARSKARYKVLKVGIWRAQISYAYGDSSACFVHVFIMSGEAGLKCLQWLIRGMQLSSSLLILAVYSYFLATLAAHDFDINTSIRAVEGISGSAALYGILGLLLICCIGGIPIASLIAIILDTSFLACFIYVAVANKHGAGNCKGEVDTPYGSGLAKSRVKGKRGSLALPTYRVACQLQTACLAAAIISV